jgi:hypothetical protein
VRRKKEFRGQDAINRLEYEGQKRATVEGIAGLALSGDVECARIMAQICRGHVWGSPTIPETVKNYLCHALAMIGAGESGDRAFNLVSARRGRKFNYWKEVRDFDLARTVRDLYVNGEASTVEDAAEMAANSYCGFAEHAGVVGKDAAKDAFQRFFPADTDKK